MNAQNRIPNAPGWWWHGVQGWCEPVLVRQQEDGRLWFSDFSKETIWVEEVGEGMWRGPVEPPKF